MITIATVRGQSMTPTLGDGQKILCVGMRPELIPRNAVIVFRQEMPDGIQALVKRVTDIRTSDTATRTFWVQGDAGATSSSSAQLGWVPAERVIGVAFWPPYLLRWARRQHTIT
jgi:hypothetical protein